jgi:hypothetical protein
VDQFRSAIAIDGWVAEDPEVHLLPSLRDATAANKGELVDSEVVESVLVLRILLPGEGRRGARQIAMSILGAVAEEASFIREVEPA